MAFFSVCVCAVKIFKSLMLLTNERMHEHFMLQRVRKRPYSWVSSCKLLFDKAFDKMLNVEWHKMQYVCSVARCEHWTFHDVKHALEPPKSDLESCSHLMIADKAYGCQLLICVQNFILKCHPKKKKSLSIYKKCLVIVWNMSVRVILYVWLSLW